MYYFLRRHLYWCRTWKTTSHGQITRWDLYWAFLEHKFEYDRLTTRDLYYAMSDLSCPSVFEHINNIALSSMYSKCKPYHKPEQTDKVVLPSTPTNALHT